MLLRVKMHINVFHWGSALGPAEGAYTALSQTSWVKGRGTGRDEMGKEKGRRGTVRIDRFIKWSHTQAYCVTVRLNVLFLIYM